MVSATVRSDRRPC